MGIFSLRSLPGMAKSWFGQKSADVFDPGSRAGLRCTDWLAQLQLVSSQLKRVTVSTEDEFLSIGERLQDFYQRADEITTLVSGLVNRLGGEESTEAMEGLTAILDTLESQLEGARKDVEQKSLETILEKLGQVETPLTGFGQMNKSLKMLGVYTKIESARLGGGSAGFESLAEHVTSLSGQVVKKADAILLQKDELAAVISKALLNVANMGSDKQAKIQAVLAKTRRSLQALTGIVDRCSSSVGTISSSAAEVTDNLGQVVVSLQAHDTVRQQVGHAAEAIDELIVRLPKRTFFPKRDAGNRASLAVEVGMLCQIQSAQIGNASAELLMAVENIIGNLHDIAVRETAMASDTGDLVGVTDQAGVSFFTEMGEDLGEVITLLTATAATNRNLSEVMAGAADTVGKIFSFVDDIEAIAYDIKLIALNSLIQANALGGMGGGLGVLAEAINRLSVEAREQTEGVTRILTEIKAITEGMCRGAEADVAAMEARVAEMRQGVEGMLASLREMNGEMAQGLTRANALVQQLSADIEEVTGGITVHQKVATVIGEAAAVLDAVTRGARALIPADEWSRETEKLQAADSRYTMHSERDIHAAVVQGRAAEPSSTGRQPMIEPPSGTAAGPPPGGSDDLGDNVELF
jgi:methyl-accepting chemotaxis protein